MAFDLEYRLCLGDHVVPLARQTLELKDLHELQGGDEDPQEFLILNLKASPPMPSMLWFTKALGLKSGWWLKHAGALPILSEIKEAIASKKPRSSRMPRNHKAIVAIQIRDRVILAQNLTNSVVLAFKPGRELQDLSWFLQEVDKDLKDLDTEEPAAKQAKLELDPEENSIIEECTRDLMSHAGCHKALFLPSRSVFRVIRKDKISREFAVLSLKKKRQEAIITAGPQAWEPVRNVFHEALGKAQEFLSHQGEQPVPLQLPAGSSADAPLVPPLLDEPSS